MRHLRGRLAMVLALLWTLAVPALAAAQAMQINEHGFNDSKTCARCHNQIHDRWKESMHARATSDPIFRASYMEAHYKSGGEARKLCLTCHAPTARFTDNFNLDVSISSEGLTCDFCHSVTAIHPGRDYPFDLDLGTVKYGPHKQGDVKQHGVAYSKLHTSAEFCAGCHEYTPNGVPVMATYSEWKASVYADEKKPCQYCHMPEVEGETANKTPGRRNGKIASHDLAGAHSMTQLYKALALKVASVDRKEDRMTVKVDLTNIGSGHRVPTGMPSRKLVLYCEVTVPGGKVYKEKVVYEKAIFDAEGNELTSDADIMLGRGALVAKDNRIYPKETRHETFTFYVPSNKQVSINAWVDYLYTPMIMQPAEMRIEMSRERRVSAGQ